MPNVVGIKFKSAPKVYYFEAGEHNYELAMGVVVETARGIEFGRVSMLPIEMSDDKIVAPLKPIIRIATKEDEQREASNDSKHDESMRLCGEIIEKSGLSMKLIDIEYTFDGSKLIVHFGAEGRIDFREIVKKLASVFHTRIELRQIGARDECKMMGGLGPCGRACCCSSVLSDYTHVTIKMAKNQNLSLNPAKISGLCGRLMCCLEYENAHYVETNKRMPKLGSFAKSPDGREGLVVGINQIKETVKLKITDKEVYTFEDFPLAEIVFKQRGNNAPDDDDNDLGEKLDVLANNDDSKKTTQAKPNNFNNNKGNNNSNNNKNNNNGKKNFDNKPYDFKSNNNQAVSKPIKEETIEKVNLTKDENDKSSEVEKTVKQ